MNSICIMSASAGTGKTFRLTEELFRRIQQGSVRPEAILATTFTLKAADELQSRIRRKLLEGGCVEAAQRIEAARIGTVNAVCGRLVADFAFDLGISPNVRVLDEQAAAIAIQRAMRNVVLETEWEELAELESRCSPGSSFERRSWTDIVAEIVNKARANGIGSAALAASADQSVASFKTLLGDRAPDAGALDAQLTSALRNFLKNVSEDGRKNTQKARQAVERALRSTSFSWSEWAGLMGVQPAVKWKEEAEKLHAVADLHDTHPRLHDDCERLIRLTFGVAQKTIDAYRRYKDELGAIDFVDQETLALKLLGMPSVLERLKGELDLVLVDEFQDTSPIQLAVFLKLAGVAGESLWVGDQKQSIYGFRGTDPALMDAAIDAILKQDRDSVQTLPHSWRSRPELVRLTSDLFAAPFAATGIPEARVRIESAPSRQEPRGLGPVMETWNLNAKNEDEDAACVASAVRQALADPGLRVWDAETGAARAARPGDVGVLCLKNTTCVAVARALAGQDIPAALSQPGLFATPEGCLALAGLSVWVDDRDALAAATLARFLLEPVNPDAWLEVLLAKPGIAAFRDLPEVARIVESRNSNPEAGAVAVLDRVMEALNLREVCLRWGRADARLQNLDAVRSLAVGYAAMGATGGSGCTPGGLVAYFDRLARDEKDMSAAAVGRDTVTVSTWHSAKGCEWPVTVLVLTKKPREPSPLGVRVCGTSGFDIGDPLKARWLRYWPSPYGTGMGKARFADRLSENEAYRSEKDDAQCQNLRLLYVAWTRARDRLILAARTGKRNDGILNVLADPDGTPRVSEFQGTTVDWVGNTLAVEVRTLDPAEPVPVEVHPGAGYVPPAQRPDHPPAYVNPSAIEVGGIAGDAIMIGSRLVLSGGVNDPLGNAIHGFLAADRPGLSPDERICMVRGLLERWGVDSALTPEAVGAAADVFRAWVEAQWPGATWRREWPLTMRRPDGSILRGTADLVLETDGELVLIDHKSFPGSEEQAVAKAATYAGQLQAYAEVLRQATGKPVRHGFIHLPVSGLVVPVAINPREETCP